MSSFLRAPFPWFGGKSRAAELIWARLGDVSNYVEPFAGSLAILLGRPTAPRVETVNDLDAMVANFWRSVAASPSEVARHADWPVSEPDLHARHRFLVERLPALRRDLMHCPDAYDAQVAGWWCWGISQWIGSGWCSGRPEQKRPSLQLPRCHGLGGMGLHGTRVLDTPADGTRTVAIYDWFAELRVRLRRVRVCCGDWTRIMGPSVILGNSFTGIVLDPPYSGDERTHALYAEDCDDLARAVREWAAEHGANPRLRIALCGYEGEHELPRGWSCETWSARSGYGGGQQRHRERIWFSPHCLREERVQGRFSFGGAA